MHICFVIGAMNFSGAEKVLTIISQNLAMMGEDVSVILLEKESGFEKQNGIKLYGAKSNGNKIRRILSRWKNIRGIVKEIKPDIVVSFGYVCNVNTIPSLLGVHIPIVLCERNDPEYDPRKKTERLSRQVLYPLANGYVFQTEKIRDFFSRAIQSKSAIIANPVPKVNMQWSFDNSTNCISTVARLDDFQKDHKTMFEAFSIFSKKHPEYILDVYGDGPDKENYLKQIHDAGMDEKIVLHGKVSNPLEKILQSKIFLLTSRFEGMPNALMEAMSIGMPCVSTDCGGGGAKELFDMCDSGILTRVGDAVEIAGALDRLVNDEESMKSMGLKACAVNDLLSEKRISEKWSMYLHQVKLES